MIQGQVASGQRQAAGAGPEGQRSTEMALDLRNLSFALTELAGNSRDAVHRGDPGAMFAMFRHIVTLASHLDVLSRHCETGGAGPVAACHRPDLPQQAPERDH